MARFLPTEARSRRPKVTGACGCGIRRRTSPSTSLLSTALQTSIVCPGCQAGDVSSPRAIRGIWRWNTTSQPAGIERSPWGTPAKSTRVRMSPDESYLASALSDGTVRVHCLADPDVPVAVLRPGQGHVTCVAFSPEGSVLATAGVHHSVRIWNVDGWTPAATYQGHADRIGAVAFSPRDPVVAFCDGVGVVRQWDWANNRVVKAVDGRHGRIMSAAYSTAGGRFATCGHDGSLCIWDDQRLEPVSDLLPKDRCRALVFTGNSRYVVTAKTGSGMGVFDMQRRSSVRCATEDDLGATIALGPIGDSEVGVVFRSSEGRVVFRRGTVLGAKTDVALEHRCQYGLFAVCPDGRKLISATPPAMAVQFWNPATGRLLDTVPDRGDAANSLACSWRGHLLAIGGNRTVPRVGLAARRARAGVYGPRRRRRMRRFFV